MQALAVDLLAAPVARAAFAEARDVAGEEITLLVVLYEHGPIGPVVQVRVRPPGTRPGEARSKTSSPYELAQPVAPEGYVLGVSPESTTVEIDLVEKDGATLLRLVHRGLPPAVVEDHQRGWIYFLGALRDALE